MGQSSQPGTNTTVRPERRIIRAVPTGRHSHRNGTIGIGETRRLRQMADGTGSAPEEMIAEPMTIGPTVVIAGAKISNGSSHDRAVIEQHGVIVVLVTRSKDIEPSAAAERLPSRTYGVGEARPRRRPKGRPISWLRKWETYPACIALGVYGVGRFPVAT